MARYLPARLILLFLAVTVSGCEVIGDIFQAGLWAGVLLVFLVIALIVWIMNKART